MITVVGSASLYFSPMATAASPPAIICPSPPMLTTPPRKLMQMPMPTSNSGVALTSVSATAFLVPNAPSHSAW